MVQESRKGSAKRRYQRRKKTNVRIENEEREEERSEGETARTKSFARRVKTKDAVWPCDVGTAS